MVLTESPVGGIPDNPDTSGSGHLLGATDIHRLAEDLGVVPTKRLGQNFVIDPGTVRRIVRTAEVEEGDQVLEIGPGLGSLTLALLEAGCHVTAVEIDPRLGTRLPSTARRFMPDRADDLTVLVKDGMLLEAKDLDASVDASELTLVANLPYNVATPLVLTLLGRMPHLKRFTVMVQREVADRMAALPGSRSYGAPSVKLAWYGTATRTGSIGRNVFWPAPNVDSALVSFVRLPDGSAQRGDTQLRERVFRLIDAAFGQRRKTLRHALRGLVRPEVFQDCGIDAGRRGETLSIDDFIALASRARRADDEAGNR
ncbi:16S rRNA (adenine(1518)-N(6)/adenine(1519)-N(6))-dimethyltransferase RsmA [uncultured Bifidobacterium sp.]|uniref:16S rRNA (adenine(1518)-N(6)/adenine(1519)-N(6))- dimethyltransferase RsmA n=1 Tax=uncultured Bifidobacterium sp. TaxID=165187 RepID=UPI0028DCA4B6|nr:16S rRNA (adenine(1518)-N(6)/adenine(1519)-N(6))-dimethyltransferase RsmA [uncultured Bifidobacterium sp.]